MFAICILLLLIIMILLFIFNILVDINNNIVTAANKILNKLEEGIGDKHYDTNVCNNCKKR